jgi:hypothetical protein
MSGDKAMFGKIKRRKVIHKGIVQKSGVNGFVKKVNATNGKRPVTLSLVHKDAIEKLEEKTDTKVVQSGWSADLSVATSMKSGILDIDDFDMLLTEQMRLWTPAQETSDYCIRTILTVNDMALELSRRIAKLDRKVAGGRTRGVAEITNAMDKQLVTVATKNAELAAFLFITHHNGMLEDGVKLLEIHEPVISPDHADSLGGAMVRHVIDHIHCFEEEAHFAVMAERAFDACCNADMLASGFVRSYPLERDGDINLLWTYNSADDLAPRVEINGATDEETNEKIKKIFKDKPELEIQHMIKKLRIPGYDENRLRALKAVATMERTRRRSQPVSSVKAPKKGSTLSTFDEVWAVVEKYGYESLADLQDEYKLDRKLKFATRDGTRTKRPWGSVIAIIASNRGRLNKGNPSAPKPSPVPPKKGRKKKLNSLDEIKEAVEQDGYNSLAELQRDYVLAPKLKFATVSGGTTSRPWGAAVAIIASNRARLNKG